MTEEMSLSDAVAFVTRYLRRIAERGFSTHDFSPESTEWPKLMELSTFMNKQCAMVTNRGLSASELVS